MHRFLCLSGVLGLLLLVQACSVPPPPDPKIPGPDVRRAVLLKSAAVIVTERDSITRWASREFAVSQAPGDADGGSATPVSPDGYFLTADHVLARMAGRNVFVLCGRAGRLSPVKARVVWRSERADLALLHVPVSTPAHYRWTSPDRWLPIGTPVVHGGVATGLKSSWGKLGTAIPPEGALAGFSRFKIDIPLQPGDSGGPVVNAYGELVGINSAVEFLVPMETAFFVDSEGNRPHIRSLEALIAADRGRNKGRQSVVN
jgi:S1-C subfamily serine protease